MNVELKIEREMVDASSRGGRAYDAAWAFTDAAGHAHTGAELERTLDWVVTGTYWCQDCHDEHEEGEYRCRLCGEMIEPGTKWKPGEHLTIPGLATYQLIVTEPPLKSTYVLRRGEIDSMPPRYVDDGVFTAPMLEWIASVQARGADLQELAS